MTLGHRLFWAPGQAPEPACRKGIRVNSPSTRPAKIHDHRKLKLGTFPDARNLRLILDSQRIVARDSATLVSASAPDLAASWRTRASTYLRLIRATHDLGGMLGDGGPAAGEASLAASRAEHPAKVVGSPDEP